MENLQFNSPMKIYSSETAEEQYNIHASQVPNLQNQQPNIQLGSGNRHFDPSKSETLRAIQEEEYNQQFGNGPQYVITQRYSTQQYPSSQQPSSQQQYKYSSSQSQQYPSSQQQYQYSSSNQQYPSSQQFSVSQQQQYQPSQPSSQQFSVSQQPPSQQPSSQQFSVSQQYQSSQPQQYQPSQQQQYQSSQQQQYYSQIPQQQQQSWDAYERSERARSQTPNYRYYNQDDIRIPSSGAPQFTTDTPVTLTQVRYNSLPRPKREDTHHNPVESGASEKGYLFGGMDFIDHANDPFQFNINDDYDEWNARRAKREKELREAELRRQFAAEYGSSSSVVFDENYRGYSANPPVKHWHYAADPCRPVNSYVSDVVECVDPVKLVGDTIANQKIPIERFLTEEEKNTLGTPFTDPTGFKPDHRTVLPEPKPEEPICYSLSAKKHLARTDDYQTQARSQSSGPNYNRGQQQSNAKYDNFRFGTSNEPVNAQQLRQQKRDVNLLTLLDDSAIQRTPNLVNQHLNNNWVPRSDIKHERWQTEGEKLEPLNRRTQVQGHVPTWSEHLERKRNIWQGLTQQVDNWVQQPAQSKVRSERPAFWTKNSASTHNTWQTAANQGLMRQTNNHNTDYTQDSTGRIPVQQDYDAQQNDPQQQQNFNYQQQVTQQKQVNQVQPQQQQQPQKSGYSTQQTYTYTQGSNQPAPKSTSQVQTTYTRQVNQQQPTSNTQLVQDFAGNRPQPTQQLKQQQFNVQSKPAPVNQQQSTQQNVDHFTYYPEEEAGDFQRPGYAPQSQKPTQNFQQAKSPPPVVPPKPQVNQQQVKPTQQFVQQSNSPQTYNQYYYKETVPENNQPPQVIKYSTNNPQDFNRFAEMQEQLPSGKFGNTFSQSHREYQDQNGQNVEYSYELTTSADPEYDAQLLKEEERRVFEQQLEPNLVSRNVTTKYYKKKTVSDNSSTSFN